MKKHPPTAKLSCHIMDAIKAFNFIFCISQLNDIYYIQINANNINIKLNINTYQF